MKLSKIAHTVQTVIANWQQECSHRGLYGGQELQPYQGRPGAMDAYALPSVFNGVRTPRALPLCTPTTNRV